MVLKLALISRNEVKIDCPYCGKELDKQGVWGQFLPNQSVKLIGHVYKCPNSEGFKTEQAARGYSGEMLDDLEDMVCESATHHVCGSFYTDSSGELLEFYQLNTFVTDNKDLIMPKFENTSNKNGRVCPYCGHSWPVELSKYEEDGFEDECEECGKKFYSIAYISISYEAMPDCGLNGEQHVWERLPAGKYGHRDFCSICGVCRGGEY